MTTTIRDIDRPNAYQIYGQDSNGKMVWAGVSHPRRPTLRAARRIQRKWAAWREAYLRRNGDGGDSPLRRSTRVTSMLLVPINNPNQGYWYSFCWDYAKRVETDVRY